MGLRGRTVVRRRTDETSRCRPPKERLDEGSERSVEGRGEHGDEGSDTIDDLKGEPVERRREDGTPRTERSNGAGRKKLGGSFPTGRCIPSELNI